MRLPYHLIHLGGRPGWWRGLLGLIASVLTVFACASVFALAPFMIWYAATGQPVGDRLGELGDLSDPTPAALAYLNLILASSIPVTMLMTWALHGLRPGWLNSILGRMRWGYFLVCLGLSVMALIITLAVSIVLPEQAGSVSGSVNEWTPTLRDFVLVVLLLTPLQAAGEEYLFRGYLLQVFGGWSWKLGEKTSAAIAIAVTSLLFAFAHGAQDLPIFFDRFAFGVVAGTLVVITGGLEAGIAMHVLNNFLAFGLALAFSDMASALNPSGGTWWNLPVTLTQSLTYLVLASYAAHRMGLTRRTESDVLAAPRAAG